MLFGIYFRVSWTDPRLIWPFEGNLTLDGRESLILDPAITSVLWIPDVYIEYSRTVDRISLLQEVHSVSMNKDKQITISTM